MKSAIVFVVSIGCLALLIYYVWKITYLHCCRKIKYYKELSNKFNKMYLVSEKWIEAHNNNISIGEYIKKNGWNNVAIYGCGDLGHDLYKCLVNEEANINIICGIDNNEKLDFPIKIVSHDQFKEAVDVIIVTAVYYFGEVEQLMKEKTSADIVSLEEIIFGSLY